MHVCPYGAMAIFILNKISLLEPKTQNRVRSACEVFIERYCWDTDVLMVAEIWSRLRAEAKQHLGLRGALFGVVHGLAPPPR
jgi:hypothetical protein